MTNFVTSAEMRAIEAQAIASGVVTGLELMERAGRGVVAAILAEWPEVAKDGADALVLCGPGNNGGDGYVVARLLAERGWGVTVLALGETSRLPPDARKNFLRFEEGSSVRLLDAENLRAFAQRSPDRPLVIVDALFGIGLTRPLPPALVRDWGQFCESAMSAGAIAEFYCVAVDVPSGLDADGGDLGLLAWFDEGGEGRMLTVTFHALKPAHGAMIAAGARVVVVGIGLDGEGGQ